MAFDPLELAFIRALRGLQRDHILAFLDVCHPVDIPPDEVIVVEGEADDSMIFVLSGHLEVYLGTPPDITSLKQLRKGEAAGEMALLGISERRTASVRTVERSELLILERKGFEDLRAQNHPVVDRIEDSVLLTLAERLRETNRRIGLLAEGTDIEQAEPEGLWGRLSSLVGGGGPRGRPPKPMEVLQQSKHFKDMDKEPLEILARHLEAVPVHQGDRILEEGSLKGDAFILATGEVGVFRATRSEAHERVGVLQPGALFGHLAMIDDNVRTATCVALKPSWLYRVPRALAKAVFDSPAVEARALRRCFLHAVGRQLHQSNQHLDRVTRAANATGKNLPTDQIYEVNKAFLATIAPEEDTTDQPTH